MFKFLTLLLSLSVRTAYIQPNPLDYEVIVGLENKRGVFQFLYERENGNYYKGSLLEQNFKYLYWKYFQKDAYNIKTNQIILKYPYKKFETGISFLKDYNLNENKFLLYSKFKTKYLELSYQNNLKDYYILEFIFKGWKWNNLEPLLVYKNYNNKKFWQIKFIFRIKLSGV